MFAWFRSVYLVCRREFRLVFTDMGVILFFLFLPTVYPIIYTLIYNPEVVRETPVAVVDNSRTAASRQLARSIDALPSARVAGYASSLSEAREWCASHDCYAVIEIPRDYDRRIGRSEQAVVSFYCDASLLLRYRALLLDLTQLQIAVDGDLRQQAIDIIGAPAYAAMGSSSTVGTNPVFIGDPSQGFASFVIPGILMLILQQSLILGITMLAGGRAERRRANGGIDPLGVAAPAAAAITGRLLCYLLIYLPMVIYDVLWIPNMFALPDSGSFIDYMLFLLPLLVSSCMLGMTLEVFVTERETSMLVIVFTSVVFLFLTGLTWPMYSITGFWRVLASLVPATWGIQGFVRLLSDGASLAAVASPYTHMWLLAALYALSAWLLQRYTAKSYKSYNSYKSYKTYKNL